MANAFNVDVYANLAVCTCRAHCCPSTGVYRGAKISSVGSFYITRLTALVHGSGLTASRIHSRCCLRPKLDVIPKLVANGILALANVFGNVSQL